MISFPWLMRIITEIATCVVWNGGHNGHSVSDRSGEETWALLLSWKRLEYVLSAPLPFLKLLRWLILPRIANEQDGVKGPIHSVGHSTSPAEGKGKNQYDSKLLIKLQSVHLDKKKKKKRCTKQLHFLCWIKTWHNACYSLKHFIIMSLHTVYSMCTLHAK